MLDRDHVMECLTGRMTAAQVAERVSYPTREVVPVLNWLHDEGLIDRVVSEDAVVRFMRFNLTSCPKPFRPPIGMCSMSYEEEQARKKRRETPELIGAFA